MLRQVGAVKNTPTPTSEKSTANTTTTTTTAQMYAKNFLIYFEGL